MGGSLTVTSFVKCEELPVSQHQSLNPRQMISVPPRRRLAFNAVGEWVHGKAGCWQRTRHAHTHISGRCHLKDDLSLVSVTTLLSPLNDLLGTLVYV